MPWLPPWETVGAIYTRNDRLLKTHTRNWPHTHATETQHTHTQLNTHTHTQLNETAQLPRTLAAAVTPQDRHTPPRRVGYRSTALRYGVAAVGTPVIRQRPAACLPYDVRFIFKTTCAFVFVRKFE